MRSGRFYLVDNLGITDLAYCYKTRNDFAYIIVNEKQRILNTKDLLKKPLKITPIKKVSVELIDGYMLDRTNRIFIKVLDKTLPKKYSYFPFDHYFGFFSSERTKGLFFVKPNIVGFNHVLKINSELPSVAAKLINFLFKEIKTTDFWITENFSSKSIRSPELGKYVDGYLLFFKYKKDYDLIKVLFHNTIEEVNV